MQTHVCVCCNAYTYLQLASSANNPGHKQSGPNWPLAEWPNWDQFYRLAMNSLWSIPFFISVY